MKNSYKQCRLFDSDAVKEEIKEYKLLCSGKSGKYSSLYEMKSQLSDELSEYTIAQRESLRQLYKFNTTETNIFISSLLPLIASMGVSIYTFINSLVTMVKEEQDHKLLLTVSYTFTILISLIIILASLWMMINFYRTSHNNIYNMGYYNMIVEILDNSIAPPKKVTVRKIHINTCPYFVKSRRRSTK